MQRQRPRASPLRGINKRHVHCDVKGGERFDVRPDHRRLWWGDANGRAHREPRRRRRRHPYGHLDRLGQRTERRAGDVDSSRHQRDGWLERIRNIHRRHVDHAERHERPRRHLVRRVFERRRQEEDVYVHADRERVGRGERSVIGRRHSSRRAVGRSRHTTVSKLRKLFRPDEPNLACARLGSGLRDRKVRLRPHRVRRHELVQETEQVVDRVGQNIEGRSRVQQMCDRTQ